MVTIEQQIRAGLPKVGVGPYNQVHAHSTGNKGSTAQNEATYMGNKDINTGFYTHVIGNGRIIQTALTGRGAWDVGGGWNGRGFASVELIESHPTKEAFKADYNIYVDFLRQLAAQAGAAQILDSGSTGVLTHDYCRRNQPANGTDHVDPYPYLATMGISREQFASDIKNGVTPAVKPSPNKAALDIVNVNAQTFQVTGWLAHTEKDLRNYTYWLFIVDEDNKEVGRFKGVKINRPDVASAIPNPSGAEVGVQFDGKTPETLTKGNNKFKLMFRASDAEGNVSHAEFWFDNIFDEAPDTNLGTLDETQPVDGRLRLAGWHLASNQQEGNRHFLFLMDTETKTEIARWDITDNSYLASPDVKSAYSNNMLVQAAKCRFDQTVDVPENVKGKRTYIMSRYASDELGNQSVADKDLKDHLIFL